MASGIYVVNVDAVALVAATAKTILELQPTATVRGGALIEWWVEFDGVTASAVPVKVELVRASAAATGTTAGVANSSKFTDFASTGIVVAKHTISAEGTATEIVEVHRIPPTSGYSKQYPLGREPQIPVSGTFPGLRLRCTAAAGVNVTAGMVWEE